jgi:hypothetical protein
VPPTHHNFGPRAVVTCRCCQISRETILRVTLIRCLTTRGPGSQYLISMYLLDPITAMNDFEPIHRHVMRSISVYFAPVISSVLAAPLPPTVPFTCWGLDIFLDGHSMLEPCRRGLSSTRYPWSVWIACSFDEPNVGCAAITVIGIDTESNSSILICGPRGLNAQ